MTDTCRTCLRHETCDRAHYDLFAPGDTQTQTNVKFLTDSTALRFAKGDGLPASICCDCITKIAVFRSLCDQAVKSDRLFRSQNGITSKDESAFAQQRSSNDIKNELGAEEVRLDLQIGDVKQETVSFAGDLNDADNNGRQNDASDTASDSGHPSTTSPPAAAAPIQLTVPPSTGKKRGRRPIVDKTLKFTCDRCGKFYRKKSLLAGHLRQHLGLVPYACDDCPKEFKKHANLQNHRQRKHTADEPTACQHPGCGKTFRKPHRALDHYERMHLGKRPKRDANCICEQCGKHFRTCASLAQHRKYHMSVDEYPYQCEMCDKRFLAKNGYELHMLRHRNIRNFPCPQCPSRMVSALELKYHMQLHEKQHKCAECPAVFQSKMHLMQHDLIEHRGREAFVCRFCSKQFTKKISLTYHEREHTGEKPYGCELCDMRFIKRDLLSTHMKMLHSS